jgi:hypothetical protein
MIHIRDHVGVTIEMNGVVHVNSVLKTYPVEEHSCNKNSPPNGTAAAANERTLVKIFTSIDVISIVKVNCVPGEHALLYQDLSNGGELFPREVKSEMFIWGTANPAGLADGYNGLFLTTQDIEGVVRDNSMDGLPVKIEHKGIDVGKVVTAWHNTGKLDILIEVDEKIFEGDCVGRFVRNQVCKDLSIGYNVALQFSDSTQKYEPMKKTFNEVSIVRSGARDQCHIHGYTVDDKAAKKHKYNDEFTSFFPPKV